ncbi:MAG: hypothetical protein ACO3SM_00495 [Sedimenticolaceae bacterium]
MTTDNNPIFDLDAVEAWLNRCLQEQHGGKVLLASFKEGKAQLAWAAGLPSADDLPHFETFARHVLIELCPSDAYWVFVPDYQLQSGHYRVMLQQGGQQIICAKAMWHAGDWLWKDDKEAVLNDLLKEQTHIPALLRRDITKMADEMEIEPPNLGAAVLTF